MNMVIMQPEDMHHYTYNTGSAAIVSTQQVRKRRQQSGSYAQLIALHRKLSYVLPQSGEAGGATYFSNREDHGSNTGRCSIKVGLGEDVDRRPVFASCDFVVFSARSPYYNLP